jgi:hypothetical protein
VYVVAHLQSQLLGEGAGGRITVSGQLGKSTRLYLKNKVKAKGQQAWFKW